MKYSDSLLHIDHRLLILLSAAASTFTHFRNLYLCSMVLAKRAELPNNESACNSHTQMSKRKRSLLRLTHVDEIHNAANLHKTELSTPIVVTERDRYSRLEFDRGCDSTRDAGKQISSTSRVLNRHCNVTPVFHYVTEV